MLKTIFKAFEIIPVLVPHTFSIRDKLFKGKESISMLTNNKQEYLGMRQHCRAFLGIISLASCTTVLTESDPEGLDK